MHQPTTTPTCKQCGHNGDGKFCKNCGQPFSVKRITNSTILHEIFHFFSHLDKGFLYTLRELIASPGKTQLAYINGHRVKHQKPFSMFFLCATITAFLYYWTNLVLFQHFHVGERENIEFFHQYMVITTVVMVPVYALITYLFFIRSKFNYAEIFILLLYNLSPIMLGLAVLQLLKFIFTDLQTELVELPLILCYNCVTNINFFQRETKWMIFLKTILASAVCFFLAGFVRGLLIDYIF